MENNEQIVTGFAVYASENYTCASEQHMLVEIFPPTQVGAAMALDFAAGEDVDRRGYSGMGAGAVAEILTPDDDEDEGGESFDSMDHPLVSDLEFGDVKSLRGYIKKRKTETFWNNHNHVIIRARHCEDLLSRYRSTAADILMHPVISRAMTSPHPEHHPDSRGLDLLVKTRIYRRDHIRARVNQREDIEASGRTDSNPPPLSDAWLRDRIRQAVDLGDLPADLLAACEEYLSA